MAYLTEDALQAMRFASLGLNVRISDRASIYGPGQMRLGDNCRIDDFCVVSGKLQLGRNVHFVPFCLIAGGTPGIVFEDYVGLAYRVSVFAQSDDYSGATMTNPTVPLKYKQEVFMPVRLGRHVIIGTGAIICPGVDLGDGSAVGAGSLVIRSWPPWSILAGSPARKIKDRRRELLELEAAYLADEAEDSAR